MFDLIVNADQMEKAIASLQRLAQMFASMISKEKTKARPVLASHVMTCLLEASDNEEEQMEIYKQVHSLAV